MIRIKTRDLITIRLPYAALGPGTEGGPVLPMQLISVMIRVERYSKAEMRARRQMTGSPLFRPLSGIIPAHNPRDSCGAAETSRCCRGRRAAREQGRRSPNSRTFGRVSATAREGVIMEGAGETGGNRMGRTALVGRFLGARYGLGTWDELEHEHEHEHEHEY